MNRLSHTILRLLLALVPVMMALASARAQGDTVCMGEVSTWVVENVPGDSYVWELYNDVNGINLVVVPGNCPSSEAYFVDGINTGDSVNVMCLEAGTYFIKITATNECPTNNLKLGKIVVEECNSYAEFLDPEPVCAGDTAILTLEITGGSGPWEVTFTDGTTYWTIEDIQSSPHSFQLIPTPTAPGSYEYWITSVTNGAGIVYNTSSEHVILIVNPKPDTSPIYRYSP